MYLFWMLSQDNQYFLLVQNYFRYLVKYWQQKYDEKGKTYYSDSKIQQYCEKKPKSATKLNSTISGNII